VGIDAKNTTGWIMIGLVGLNVFYGLFIVLFTTIIEIVLSIKGLFSKYFENIKRDSDIAGLKYLQKEFP
jgi:hypothetical protein